MNSLSLFVRFLALLSVFASSFAANAHTACTKISSADNNPYKIHMPNEVVSDSEKLPFSFSAADNVSLSIRVHTALSFTGGNVLKNRHGEVLNNIADHIGYFIEFNDGTEIEFTETAIPLPPDEVGGLCIAVRYILD